MNAQNQTLLLKDFSENLINNALLRYLAKAHQAREDAGYSGAMHDGGSAIMKQYVKIVQDMRIGNVPEFLTQTLLEIQREQDSEYQTFIRLKNKFEK